MHTVSENDTTYICRYYQKNGPMVRWETYYDSNLTIPNGVFAWYNFRGELDSTGSCHRGKKDKSWKYGFNSDGKAILIEEFAAGHLLKKTNYKNKTITFPSGITETLQETKDENNTKKEVAQFINGGIPGWLEYLTTNIKTPDRFILISGPRTSAFVGVEFEINLTGNISHVFIYHSREWSVDMEAIRVIQNSPLWKPASIDGELTFYRHRQKITFNVGD